MYGVHSNQLACALKRHLARTASSQLASLHAHLLQRLRRDSDNAGEMRVNGSDARVPASLS